ncbi:tyrosine-type recombinase/integrase [Rhodoblastus sp.]|jgi:integrase|uniref:tyrosine-type recombinase/integrase n=1 Tax=Rhodoblastus sp. TaxID=1962975 RepID=UPI0025D486A7|nr:tyrosine-type recombinase/integrase [Rhodoblastus sp.]
MSTNAASLAPLPRPADVFEPGLEPIAPTLSWPSSESPQASVIPANPQRAPATLGEVLARLAQRADLPRQRRHDLSSAVRKVAGLIGVPATDIPADAAVLRSRLSLLTPAGAGMTARRLKNVRALLTAALDLTGAKIVRRRSLYDLAPCWKDLLARVDDRYDRARLSRFFGYASAQGLPPDHINDEVVARFAEGLRDNSLVERQTQIVRDVCLTWNRCVAAVEGWPNVCLSVPDRRRNYALPVAAYPKSFADDLDAYLTHLAGDDLFAETGRRPASPTTLKDVRLRVLQIAAALVHSGRPPDTILSLADLVTKEAMKIALNFFWVRNGKRKTGQIHNFALTAIKIAKYWVEAPMTQVNALQVIRRHVDPGGSGMTVRNRARLRQFDDPENLRRLIDMPDAIFARLPKSGAVSYVDAVRLQSALAVATLLVAPMRIKNLASLRFDRHLVQTRIGGVRHIVIPAQEVKNREALTFEVSANLGELLDAYLARGRPVLAEDAGGFLFPARQGGAKTPAQLAAQIKRTIAQETGVDLNAHAFRHLLATLFLRENPGEYETAKQFLGHKSLATTVKSYCGVEQSDALRRLDALIDRHRTRDGAPRHA